MQISFSLLPSPFDPPSLLLARSQAGRKKSSPSLSSFSSPLLSPPTPTPFFVGRRGKSTKKIRREKEGSFAGEREGEKVEAAAASVKSLFYLDDSVGRAKFRRLMLPGRGRRVQKKPQPCLGKKNTHITHTQSGRSIL